MITQHIDFENKHFTFEFTGNKDIYNFVRYFIETRETLTLVNLYIKYYDDEEKRKACECLLDISRYFDMIIDAVEKMKNSKIVTYKQSFTSNDDLYNNTLFSHFEMLYVNQAKTK